MKYLLFVLFLFVVGCGKVEKGDGKINKYINYNITVIDSCEYIVAETTYISGGVGIVHKQNCKFCKQRNEYPN